MDTVDTISVRCMRGVKRAGRDIPAGSLIEVSREEYEAASARSPGIYMRPCDIVDPAVEAAKAKAKQDEIERAEKLRRLEAQRAYKAQEHERLAGWIKQHQSREEAAKAAKAEAEALIAERAKAKRARASAQV